MTSPVSTSQPCASSSLQAQLAPHPTSTSGQAVQQITLTNVSTTACILAGFPDLTLVGTGRNTTTGTITEQYRWPLQNAVRDAPEVAMPPSGTAQVSITYLNGRGGSANLDVTAIELELPGSTTRINIPWDKEVLLQDAATRPGTYSGPFEIVR
ncbi:DUF4232 domain-containing protein [Nocardia sp. NPDC060259]|uniref:DUF4232 domain-containing protein n=1 Tax=Nocardia sp. NPDC060259 TaxID=3347088 RepID=UPI0036619E2B